MPPVGRWPLLARTPKDFCGTALKVMNRVLFGFTSLEGNRFTDNLSQTFFKMETVLHTAICPNISIWYSMLYVFNCFYIFTLKPSGSLATLRMISSLSAVPENTPSWSVSSVGSLATPLGTEVVSIQKEGKNTVMAALKIAFGWLSNVSKFVLYDMSYIWWYSPSKFT